MKKIFFYIVFVSILLAGCSRDKFALQENIIQEIPETNKDVVQEIANIAPSVFEKASPVSIQAMIEKEFQGTDLSFGKILDDNSSYTRYYITYKSEGLKISGIMNIPKGTGPFPVLILNHGHIDTNIYTNGRGLKREQDYLARRGYVVLHTDYRNHADSDKDTDNETRFRLGYAEDAINAVLAVKNSELPYFDKENIGMLGHSMGGGVTLNTLVVRPDLVKAAVLFAPVSADYRKNFEKWTRQRSEISKKIIELYGTPTTSPKFWDGISAINYFERISAPIQLHHGTDDASVPLKWSDELEIALKKNNKDIEYFIYNNEPHEFINAWPLVMERTVNFFDTYLKSE